MKRISWAFAVVLLVAVPAIAGAQIENPDAARKYNEGASFLRQGKYPPCPF